MRMRRKGSNPSTMLMMMRTVMAAQRETVVARQMCWEQYTAPLRVVNFEVEYL